MTQDVSIAHDIQGQESQECHALEKQSSARDSPPHQPTPNHYYELMQVVAATTGDYTFQSNSSINLYGYFRNCHAYGRYHIH